MTTSKNKHLTLDDRNDIQHCLDCGMSFKAIAARIGKDPTTVSKEVKKYLKLRESSCKLYKVDDSKKRLVVCNQLVKAPFVCNPCKKRHQNCSYQKPPNSTEPMTIFSTKVFHHGSNWTW